MNDVRYSFLPDNKSFLKELPKSIPTIFTFEY